MTEITKSSTRSIENVVLFLYPLEDLGEGFEFDFAVGHFFLVNVFLISLSPARFLAHFASVILSNLLKDGISSSNLGVIILCKVQQEVFRSGEREVSYLLHIVLLL